MDNKNILKKRLSKLSINEAATPGIDVTKKAQKKSGKINKDGVAAIDKEVKKQDKAIKNTVKGKKVDPNVKKYNYNGDSEEVYHDEMEIMNGQEMIQYEREPNQEFKDRAKESIEGSTRMGNKGGKGVGNAEATWGASDDDFGKKLVKRVKGSNKKRSDAEKEWAGMGDVQVPVGKGNVPHIAVSENKNNNNKVIKKEGMKRLRFNKNGDKPFNGVNNALKLIPEGYRVDEKEFVMTDGNESYKIRWEGTLAEGKAIVLTAEDKNLVNEDMNRMRALMGYKSENTLGLLKGNARIDENKAFKSMYSKSILMTEEEDIESVKPKTGSAESLDDAVSVAPEATKHVEGSASTDDGTEAPEPAKGEWEEAPISQAPEATAHVEGSVSTDKGTKAPAPAVGEWDKIKKPQAAEAKEDINENEEVTENEVVEEADEVTENEVVEESEEVTENEEKAPKDTSGAKSAAKSADANKSKTSNFGKKGYAVRKGGKMHSISKAEYDAANSQDKKDSLFGSKNG